IAQRVGLFLAVNVGALAAIYAYSQGTAADLSRWAGVGVLAGILILFFFGLRLRVGVAALFYSLLGSGIALAYFGVL
ncbi:hypothetical protein JW933_00530, partial [candidate division FCPU426 bacterium]|nr:hypothetical protein [candidate division FCPU426 bacterium]